MPQALNSVPGVSRWSRRVLVTRLSALGDVAMTVPVLYSACRRNPDVLFVMVTRDRMTGLFVNPPANLHVIGIDPSEHKGLGGLWRLARRLFTTCRIDAYADLHDVLRTKVLRLWAHLHRIPCAVIDKDRRHKRRMTRHSDKELLPLPSSHTRYADTLRRLGLQCDPEADFTSLYAEVPADPALYAAATPPRRPGERWIGIAPFAAHRGKIYPAELMGQVIDRLSRIDGVRIFVFGAGAAEAAVIDGWARGHDCVVSTASLRMGFAAELALMSALDVMLTMDSGNMHMAALTGTRVLSIWGATHPYCGFMGWRQSGADTIQLALACRPCSVYGNRPCARGDYHCLAGITPARVAEAVITALG